MPDIRSALRGSKRSAGSAAERPGVTIARITAKLVFVGLLALLILYSVSTDIILLAILASLAVGLMLRSVLPTESFKSRVQSLWSGEAGESTYKKAKRRIK